MAGMLSLLLAVGVFQWDMSVNAAEYVQAVFSEELSEDGTFSDITIEVLPESSDVKVVRIVNPDGSIMEDADTSMFRATENQSYDFQVFYAENTGEESEPSEEMEETFSYEVTGINEAEEKITEESSPKDRAEEFDTEEVEAQSTDDETAVLADGDIQVNSVTFPDDEFRDYLLYDLYVGTVITQEEISRITSISCSNRGIENLKGIEYFTELTTLDCSNNNLTILNLSSLKKLTSVNCSGNRISTLNIGANYLDTLDCSNNKLTKINYTRYINPEGLTADGQTAELTAIYDSTYGRWRTTDSLFNYYEGTSLGSYALLDESELFIYTYSEEPELEFTTYPTGFDNPETVMSGTITMTYAEGGCLISEYNFPDANFRSYLREQRWGTDGLLTDAEISSIQDLDCSSRSISSLQGIENFSQLGYLYCSNNRLDSLDIRFLNTLTNLDCSNNRLTSLNIGSNHLSRLNCSNNKLSSFQKNEDGTISDGGFYGDGQIVELPVAFNPESGYWENTESSFFSNTTVSSNGYYSGIFQGENGEYYICVEDGGTTAEFTSWPPTDYLRATMTGTITFEYPEGYPDEGYLINKENFPDENFRNYLNGQTYGRDGFLSMDEISGVRTLTCDRENISSLEGIQLFSNITTLNCEDNNLKELDVSSNTKLKTIYAGNNELTSLNIGTLSLTRLSCEENKLTKIEGTGSASNFSATNQSPELQMVYDKETGGWKSEDGIFAEGVQTEVTGGAGAEYDSGRLCIRTNDTIVNNVGFTTFPLGGNKVMSGTITLSYTEGIVIDEDHFPDLKFREFLLGLKEGIDGFFTVEELAAITEMDCSSCGISDLSGIEYFTSLEDLRCIRNSLKSLDVSQNAALKDLNCEYNNLAELNLGALNLENLNCYSNRLTHITGDGFKVTQSCESSGQFPSLEMSYANGVWRTADNTFGEGTIFTEKVSLITPGNYAEVSDMEIKYSQFEWRQKGNGVEINVAGRVGFTYPEGILINEENFPDENFRNVLLELEEGKDGFFTTVELAGITALNCQNKGIKDLTGINYFTALEELNCSANELTSLDIAYLENLKRLYCAHNELTSLNFGKIVNLVEIDCGYNHLKTVPPLGVMHNLYKFEGRNQTLAFPVTYDTEDAVYKTAEFVLESGTSVTGEGISFDDIFCQISLETVSAETQARFSLEVADTYTPNLEGTITFTNVKDITVKGGIITESEAKKGADTANFKELGLITASPEDAADTVGVTVDNETDFTAAKRGDYRVSYTWTDIPQGDHSEKNTVRIVQDGGVISADRSQSIYAGNITVNASERKQITADDILTESRPQYNRIDEAGNPTINDKGAFRITEEDIAKIQDCGGGEVQITVTHTESGMEKKITVHINPDEPTALVIIPKEIQLEKTEGDRNVEASAQSSVKVAPGLGADVVTEDITIMSDATFPIKNEEGDLLNCNVYVNGKMFGGSLIGGDCRLAVLNVSGKREQAFEIRAVKDERDPNTRGTYTGIMDYTVRYGE